MIGLSVDSNSSHLAWLHNIFQNTGVEIPFPVIDDIKEFLIKISEEIMDETPKLENLIMKIRN